MENTTLIFLLLAAVTTAHQNVVMQRYLNSPKAHKYASWVHERFIRKFKFQDCQVLDVAHAQIEILENGLEAFVTCEEDHFFSDGSSETTLICIDGDWRGKLENCSRITCETTEILHSKITSGVTVKYKESLQVTCNDGYTSSRGTNSFTLTCNECGVLDGIEACVSPVCQRPDVEHAEVQIDEHGLEALVSCEEDHYFIDGSSETTLICFKGDWRGKLENCSRITCETTEILQSNITSGITVKYKESLPVTCNEGYTTPNGSSSFTLTCNERGMLDGTEACLKIDLLCPENVDDYTYLGCYEDKSDHDLDFDTRTPHDKFMSAQFCCTLCAHVSYEYFGLQNGRLCLCGNSYGRYEKKPESDCNGICTGDDSQYCGGPFRNSIFHITRP